MSFRSYGGGGGRYTPSSVTLSFPPFTWAVKWLIIANIVVFLTMLLLGALSRPLVVFLQGPAGLLPEGSYPFLSLVPQAVTHGYIWQLVTYSFLHAGLGHIFFNMLTLWMFGSRLESDWRHRKFLEFYFYCVVAAALTTVGIAYLGTTSTFGFLGISPLTTTVGASGGIYGVMVAFALLYGDMEFFLFPLPIHIKAKYLVTIFILLSLVGALQGMGGGQRGEAVANFAHLGGALFGWIYVRFLPARGLGFASSERAYGLRNRYQQWKRRRMAKKFEVYMRRHDRDRSIDSYGRPDDEKRDDKDRPPWVN